MTHPRRETSLFMGVGILLTLVAILFFGLTLAARQLAQRRARWQALHQQRAQAEQEIRRPAPAGEAERLTEASQAAARLFVTEEAIPEVRHQLETLAAEVSVRTAFLPALTPGPPAHGLPGFEGCYQVIALVAMAEGRYQDLALYLSRATALTAPAVALRSCTITPTEAVGGAGVRARVVFETFLWVPGALPKRPIAPPAAGARPLPASSEASPAAGRDPFDARWQGPPAAEGMALNGIVWDPRRPTCVLNGLILGVGGVVHGYTVVAILPGAVVLRGPRELVLAL